MNSYKALMADKNQEMRLTEASMRAAPSRYLRMLRSGVCGTDKHIIKGDRLPGVKLPRVLGHENVAEMNGERVTWPAIFPCMKCDSCRSGRYNVCQKNIVCGLTTKDRLAGGQAEYFPLQENMLFHRVPDAMDTNVAVLVETAASTKPLCGMDLKGKDVLVVGSGAIGLVGSVHARSRGTESITMVGHREQSRLIGKTIDRFFEKGTEIEELGEKFDVVYDAGGDPESYEYAVGAVKPGGIVSESACMVKRFKVDIAGLINKEAILKTQLGYLPEDFGWASRLVAENQSKLKRIITHVFGLEEVEKARDVILHRRYGKIMFSMD